MASDPYMLIELAESTADPAARQTALAAAIHQLREAGETSAEAAYALGYAWYLMLDETEARRVEVLKHLGEALRLQPTHLYARLYLAHTHFDAARFDLALPILLGFDACDFSNRGQAWRDVKVAELALCCLLELHDDARLASAVQELLTRASRVDEGDLPVSRELTKTLQAFLRRAR
jgi:tetratricopeptide (TPR) repeat protein